MQAIKEKLLGYRTKKTKNPSPRRTLNYQDAKRIGVLFKVADEDKHDDINNFIHALERDGKKVEALTFFNRDHDNPYDFKYEFFTEKDISVLGAIKSNSVSHFIAQDFDFLFCISREPIEAFNFIMARSKAKCRVGKYAEGHESIYELMISNLPTDGIDRLTNDMMDFAKGIVHN